MIGKYNEEGILSVLKSNKIRSFTRFEELIKDVLPYNKIPKEKKIKLMNRFDVSIWYNSIKGNSYVISADIGDGTGKDYTIIYVFDITNPLNIK